VRIFHIATLADWTAARESGAYTTSTRGVTLEQEGYIHASRADQWEGVRARFYADVTAPRRLTRPGQSARCRAGTSTCGTASRTTVPASTSLSSSTEPPCASAIARTIGRPRPTPWVCDAMAPGAR
jgi:hypothetical protein